MKEEIVITNEQYKKLNNYYNELCLGLSVNDSFLLYNLRPLGVLSVNLLELLDDLNLEGTPKEDRMTFLDIYEQAKELMKNINPNYLDEFNNIINNGLVQVNYDRLNIPYEKRNIFGNSVYTPFLDFEKRKYYPNKDSIYIDETFNYDAITVLIHEFFHKINFSDNKASYLLTEYISIYFEIYAYELLKNQGIELEKLSLNYRLYDLKLCADFLCEQGFFLYTYDQLGNFDNDTHKYINYSSVSKNQFNLGLLDRLKEFEKYENEYKNKEQLQNDYTEFKYYLVSKYNKDYRYFIGTLLAYYSLYNINKEKVLELNEALINNSEISFDEALDILEFKFNKENQAKAGIAIIKYAKENGFYKEKQKIMKM